MIDVLGTGGGRRSPDRGVAILDYGSGNVRAIANVYHRAGIRHFVATKPEHVMEAERMILPGVGAFDGALERLHGSGLFPALEQRVLRDRRPILGICVGMQLLADRSEEGQRKGLGWIPGRVSRFTDDVLKTLPLPHMGWNQIQPVRSHILLTSLEEGSEFYFLHSYHFECEDPSDVLAMTTYGRPFASMIQRENVLGVQCHPEKSHASGIRLLANFGNT